jgi:2,3-bisphosphoglycerate-dependent phosphoglycerate mutase
MFIAFFVIFKANQVMARHLLSLLLGVLMFLVCSCKKEESQTTVVTVRDTVYLHDTTYIPSLVSDTITTLIVLRHAERENSGNDPALNPAGITRAAELSRLLSNVPVAAIYTTPFNRTRQTVQPLANAKGLSISEYSPNKPYAELVSEIVAARHGTVSVIVGHSNTVPELLKEISHNSFHITIGEEQYDNLFIVSLPDKLSARIMHLKFGAPTP